MEIHRTRFPPDYPGRHPDHCCSVRNIPRDDGARSNARTSTDPDWGDELRVAPHESALPDLGAMLHHTIKVRGYRPRANIRSLPDGGIS